MQPISVRRVITGHDDEGAAIIVDDAICPHVRVSEHRPGVAFHNLWTTDRTPAPIDGDLAPVTAAMSLPPPPGGTNFRFVEFGPERDYVQDPEAAARGFAELGNAAGHLADRATARHPAMHRTASVDYGIILEGEIWLIMDKGETLLKQGDVCIQRGTNHAWANRSDKRCLVAFILIDGATA